MQFLQHDGYVETARAFAEDIRVQKESLNLGSSEKVAVSNIKDDEDANRRQRERCGYRSTLLPVLTSHPGIRSAILAGEVDHAIKLTNTYYPHVLRENEQVQYRLQCRRLIEMMRKAATMKVANDTKTSNGMQEMDVDDQNDNDGAALDGNTADDADAAAQAELEQHILSYSLALGDQYKNDPRGDISTLRMQVFGLMAASNPLKDPQYSRLLDRNGRVAFAEELNSAILRELSNVVFGLLQARADVAVAVAGGKSSRAAVEKLYGQTTVLLDDLRKDGGDAAFVSVQNVVDGIPKPNDP